jgi:hypothetical protein
VVSVIVPGPSCSVLTHTGSSEASHPLVGGRSPDEREPDAGGG